MAKIAFILLCHKDPEAIIAQAERLTAMGDYIAIHFDSRAKQVFFDRIMDKLGDNPNVAFAARRVRCGWGEWSLVRATLNALTTAESAFPDATHFALISGDCMPIKSADYIHRKLDEEDCDIIEHNPFFDSDWVKVGPGDFMWLRAFCPQACIATGDGPFRYLLYKDVNRHVPL